MQVIPFLSSMHVFYSEYSSDLVITQFYFVFVIDYCPNSNVVMPVSLDCIFLLGQSSRFVSYRS